MKFKIQPDTFINALKAAGATVENSSSLPILSFVLLEADHIYGQVTITGGDLRTMVKAYAPAVVEQSGAICLPYDHLLKLVRTLDASATCTLDETRFKITSAQSKAALTTRPPGDYPPVKTYPISGSLTFDGAEFRRMFAATAFCAHKSDTRPILQGLHIDPTGEKALIYAADGSRAARYEATCTQEGNVRSTTIPVDAIKPLVKLIKDDQTVTLGFTDVVGHMVIRTPDFYATVQALGGRYPDVSNVIPSAHHETTIIVPADTLLPALKRASIFSVDDSHRTEVVVTDGVVSLYGKSIERGDTLELLEDATVTGEGRAVFDTRYLFECADAFASFAPTVTFSLSPERPLLMQADDVPVTYVIMPMSR